MSTVIESNNSAHFECDSIGCNDRSETFVWKDNIAEIDEKARKKLWYISFTNDKAYCPRHSPYNR